MHDLIADLDIYEAESVLGMLTGLVSTGYQAYQAKVKLSDLEVSISEGTVQALLDLSKDQDVQSILKYAGALHNAINYHKYEKTKAWDVKSLEINLL